MKRLVQVKDCDRCPVNKRRPATHKDIVFGFGDTKWKIDLCDQHYDMLSRDMYAWGLLGESVELETKRTFTGGTDLRRLAELREQQAREDREIAKAGRDYSVVAHGSKLVERLGGVDLPHAHKSWVWTQHALDRLDERGVDPSDVLWACVNPESTHTAREPGLLIHERGITKVVVNPKTKVIITVALIDINERKAVGL